MEVFLLFRFITAPAFSTFPTFHTFPILPTLYLFPTFPTFPILPTFHTVPTFPTFACISTFPTWLGHWLATLASPATNKKLVLCPPCQWLFQVDVISAVTDLTDYSHVYCGVPTGKAGSGVSCCQWGRVESPESRLVKHRCGTNGGKYEGLSEKICPREFPRVIRLSRGAQP